MDYTTKNRSELIALCKARGLKGYSTKKKEELIALLSTSSPDVIEHVTAAVPEGPKEPELTLPLTLPLSLPLNPTASHLIHGDCLAHMKTIPTASIDMVCTDPPYFLDGLGDEWNKTALDAKGSSAMIGNLPKGMKFDRDQSRRFNEFYSKIATEVFRILKPGGAFLSFSSPRLYHSMAWAIESAGFEIRDMLGWIYTQSQVKAFSQDHIIDKDKSLTAEQKAALKVAAADWRTPQLKPAIEPIALAVKPVEGRFIDNFAKYGTGLMNCGADTKVGPDAALFPANIMTTEENPAIPTVFLVPKPTKTEKGTYNTHLSVKPVALIEHLIRLFTKPGATVLDPFIGSGTTAVACIQSGRAYIGCDTNAEYIAIAEKRIGAATATPTTHTAP